jgi:hypothetical protein
MPGKMSAYLQNLILERILRGGAYTPAPQAYLGLCTISNEATDGSSLVEVSPTGTGYVRRPVSFSTPANAAVSNSGLVQFPVATSTWGSPDHFVICDAASGGNVLYWGQLPSPIRTINTNEQFEIVTGNLSVGISGSMAIVLANQILDHTLRSQPYTPPTAIKVALFSAYTNDTTWTEVADVNYGRLVAAFNPCSGGVTATSATMTWNSAGADYTVSHVALFDSTTNLLFRQALTPSILVNANKSFRINSGSLTQSID